MSAYLTSKTQADIDNLKRQWRDDPCWDIEDTEGFEAHHDELLTYRAEVTAAAELRRAARLERKAKELGIGGNVLLAGYIDLLENRLRDIVDRVTELELNARAAA